MEQISTGIRALASAILDDAKAEADRIVAEAREAARRAREQAEREAAEIRRRIEAEAEREITHLKQQALAMARLEAQRILLKRREELIEKVFTQAAEQLEHVREKPDYKALLRGLLIDAVERLGEPAECVVRLAGRDRSLLGEEELKQLTERWQGRVQLRLGDPAEISGGVVLEADGGRKRYDNSLAARLERERTRLRPEVYRLLQRAPQELPASEQER